ncbi:MAG: hypothetical protein PHU71_07380, partial [Candidatus Gracilibacteria bacterium]|nr:hypothetical protein [Candidatus Gracilibacteria bacterium]
MTSGQGAAMAAKAKKSKKPDKRPLTVAEAATALIWYVNGAKTVEQIAHDLGVTDRAVDAARIAGDWDDALDTARQALSHAAKDYAKGLANVQRQVCEDDLRVGDRLARISDRLIKALDATLAEMDAADDKGASACEWRLSRLAAAWERVQRARRLAVNLHTDK